MITVLILVLVLAIVAVIASFFFGVTLGFRVLSNLVSKNMDNLGIPEEQKMEILKIFAEDFKIEKKGE